MKSAPVAGDLAGDITHPHSLSPSPTTTSSSSAPAASASTMDSLRRGYNTKNLGARIGADVVSAGCAGALIAPLVAIIDRSIMENTSGRSTLTASLRTSLATLLRRPHTVLLTRPTALLFLLYGATYASANAVDTLTSVVENRPASLVTAGGPKFAASSAVNVGLCIYKDQVFARMFGPPGAAPRPVGLASYGLFAARDCMTIFASFIVPPLLAPHIDARLASPSPSAVTPASPSPSGSGSEGTASSPGWISGATCAQFLAPAAVQLVSTPLHLLGLDVYNRPGPRVSLAERWRLVRRMWLPSAAARVCRIVPAFGVGGVVNTKLRRGFMGSLE